MKKQYIFALVALVVIVAAVILMIINSKNMNKDTTPSTSGNAIPPLATGGDSNTPVSQQTVSVDDVNKQISGNVEAAKKNTAKVSDFTPKDSSSGKIVPFRDFLQSSNVKIDESVLQLTDVSVYSIFNCSQGDSASSTGLIFEVNKNQDLKSYTKALTPLTENVKKWESKMFQGLAPIFFSGESFSQSPSFNETSYDTSNGINSATIRFANLKSDSGKTFSIDWSMFLGKIFISNNKECLRQALNEHQEKLEP